jgi:zinc transport system substrate-binding protein
MIPTPPPSRVGSSHLWAFALLTLLAAAAGAHAAQQKMKVVVSILPQEYFVKRVGGDFVDVDVLVGPGQSPHSFDATPRQLDGISHATLYFSIGIDFENTLVPRIARLFPNVKLVDTRRNVPLRMLTPDERAAEEHHEHAEQEHASGETPPASAEAPDPHIWLNPLLVKIQAQTICDALAEADPAHADTYRENLAAFIADLTRVNAQIAAALAPLKGKAIFVFHPAFGYFADAYGLKQVPVEVGGKEPTAKQLAGLITQAKAAGVKVIFVQPQFSAQAAEAVAQAIGGAVVPLDDLARDYLKNLEDLAAKIKSALH